MKIMAIEMMTTTIVVIPYSLVIPHCGRAINPRDWRGIVARMMTTRIADAINHHGRPPHPTLPRDVLQRNTKRCVQHNITQML